MKKTRRASPKKLKTEQARRFRADATGPERVAWRLLRNRCCLGLKFRRQWPLHGFIADFYCVELKLAIELDGAAHRTELGARMDGYRDEALARRGVRVVRIGNQELSAERLEAAIAEARKCVPPLRQVGEGDRG